jgi:S1-C subfamily serine protease
MRLATWCLVAAAFVWLGQPYLQSAEDNKDKDAKTEAKKDTEVKGKIPEEIRKKLKDAKVTQGVVLIEVTADGAAQKGHEKANGGGETVLLEEGDVISQIDGKDVKTAEDYHKLMKGKDEKKLTVINVNDGKPVTAYFTPKDGRLEITFEVVATPVG